jgi:hypothetical protein
MDFWLSIGMKAYGMDDSVMSIRHSSPFWKSHGCMNWRRAAIDLHGHRDRTKES